MRHFRRVIPLPRVLRSHSLAICGVVVFVVAVAIVWWLPIPAELQKPTVGTLTLLDCRGREIAELASPEARAQLPVTLEKMGPWLPRVTVALEDRRFYGHRGVDWHAIAAACTRNLRSGHLLSGASTITQQLVKLATGREQRSWSKKLYEAIIAWKLEHRWSKERILAEYLNRSSYGNRRIGPEAAARAYFGKPARDLTLSEAIFLSGLPQAPTRFNPWRHPEQASRKYSRSLARLVRLGVITRDQQSLLASPPKIAHMEPLRLAPHFVDAVIVRNPGLRGTLTTTLDLDLQTTIERLVHSHLSALNRHDIRQAAVVVVENATGAIRAMVGSENYAASQINGATLPRSCGSTLKPFVYLDAIDKRLLTAASLLPDTPDAIRDEYADYDPQNYNRHYLGPVRLREALGCSLNVPAVFALSRLGARPAFHQLQKWGFGFQQGLADYGAGFVLGNAETRLVDLAAAYAGLARGGTAMRAKFLAGEHEPVTRIASKEATAIVNDILCDNDARQKSFGLRSPLAFEQRIAAKTGTSSGFRDAWTVGFDKEHTVAVWAGNFDGRPMRDTFAVRAATPLWAAVIQELLRRDHPLDPPEENDSLVRREICKATGSLPSRFSQAKLNELFLAGTEPREDSADYFASDGKLLLPDAYGRWCASRDNTIGAHVRSDFRITSPSPNAHYEIDPVLPPSQQMVELTAAEASDVEWFVNHERIFPQQDSRFFWQLAPGEWKLRAVSRFGSAEETVTVD
ncbi:MAG TPA: penicillin-binding protein 1C [Candidatus Udaeobacter sp.]|nr:penicillin-binding protein 1C [Candidatus Udaeobacter sp.]